MARIGGIVLVATHYLVHARAAIALVVLVSRPAASKMHEHCP